jgi:hypothetical protein
MPTVHRVTVLLDWDTARRLDPKRENTVRGIERAIDQIQIAISNYLQKNRTKDGYRIRWRVYHGWHQGKTKTGDRILFEKYMSDAKGRTIQNVSFSVDYEFSGTLSCESSRAPIFDTCRSDRHTGAISQKMVDTMLVCDLLHLARSRESSLLLVIADDDDIIPALFTAEAWKAKIAMLYLREHANQHLKLNGIAERMIFQ